MTIIQQAGGPAFPCSNEQFTLGNPQTGDAWSGMSKREYMAAATLAGIMPWALSVNMSAESIAHHAVAVADALLLELAKP